MAAPFLLSRLRLATTSSARFGAANPTQLRERFCTSSRATRLSVRRNSTDPDLIAVVTFCVLGLLVAFNVILRFPDLGALIEQYNQF